MRGVRRGAKKGKRKLEIRGGRRERERLGQRKPEGGGEVTKGN